MIKKLKSNSGESLAEVLIAALVISLGALLLSTMIRTSWKMINKEEQVYKSFINDKNKFEVIDDSVDQTAMSAFIIRSDGLDPIETRDIIVYSREVDPGVYFYRYEVVPREGE